MDSAFWMIIAIAALVILIAVVFVYLLLKKKIPHREPDYYVWFWIGICWIGAGVALGVSAGNYALFAIGLVFMIVSLVHRKHWKTNHLRYKDLTPVEKKFKIWVMVILGILILGGLIAFLIIG